MADPPTGEMQQVSLGDSEGVPVHPYCATYSRTSINSILGATDGGKSLQGKTVVVGGWVKSGREQGGGAFSFIQLNDGSIFTDIQIYIAKEVAGEHGKELLKTGSSLLVRGVLSETPEGAKQSVELKASEVLHFGSCDSTTYPMAKKKHGMEFLREKAHLRPRTNVIGAVARIRNQLAYATHNFFQQHGFLYVHTPLITASDCEGAGEMFQVTTLLSDADKRIAEAGSSGTQWLAEATAAAETVKTAAAQEAEQGEKIRALKEQMKEVSGDEKSELNKKVQVEVKTLKGLKDSTAAAQEKFSMVGGLKRVTGGSEIDYSQDFFGRRAYLTVSGQLNGEYYASALSNIYTFGPTFRAEESHTSRHLAEFWMIEPEMAFCALEDDMQCAEDYVRHCCKHILQSSGPDLDFLVDRIDPEVISRLKHVADTPFKRLTYTSAIELLKTAVDEGHKFENSEIVWGMDMSSEHERYLCETVFKQPTIVYNYPKDIKAFYMKLNDDGKTVAAMDLLVPGIGELVGGSQREDSLETLKARIVEQPGIGEEGLEAYEGYMDLRKYGSVPHSGFGLGFERLIMFATGISNIRDVIPFPRYPGNAAY